MPASSLFITVLSPFLIFNKLQERITKINMGRINRFWTSGIFSREFLKVLRPVNATSSFVLHIRQFGQPAAQTHPHLIAEGEVTPGINKGEFHARRSNLVKLAAHWFRGVKSVKNHLFVFPSAPTSYMTNDIPYVFRQNTDFLYFSGFQEPNSVLIIEADINSAVDGTHTSTLFVPSKDPERELWDGPRSGTEGALHLTGVDAAFVSKKLKTYLEFYNSEHKDFVLWYQHLQPVHNDFHKQVIDDLIRDKRYKALENSPLLSHNLRVIKSPAEIQLMQDSAKIACDAFKQVMKFSKTQINESQLWAKMDYECRIGGAEFLAYPPVVAGGDRANIIHYITNNQVIQGGDLVLMDAGCELHGYASDITRTWPVSGKFTEPQKRVYNAVLRVQESCIQKCRVNSSLDDLFYHMLAVLASELTLLGIIPPNVSKEQRIQMSRKYCPHHIGHYLGMDVHDTSLVARKLKLKPGMVITIEPGIYIPASDLNVPPELRGMGIRIEDNILITDSQPVNLSASCPKTVEDIEILMDINQCI